MCEAIISVRNLNSNCAWMWLFGVFFAGWGPLTAFVSPSPVKFFHPCCRNSFLYILFITTSFQGSAWCHNKNAASRGRDTYRHGRPCCRRRARRNLRCRTSQRPRSDWFRCTARRTAPSSGGGNCPADPYRLAAPWGRTVCRADGFSSSGGGEPEPEQRVTADSLSVWSVCLIYRM